MKGIDVSAHQGAIDWEAVKSDGIEFAIIRAGYGLSTTDDYFERNITEAIRVGLKVGVYWFSYALDKEDAVIEADYCHFKIQKYKIDFPVFYDFEYATETYAEKNGVTYTNESRSSIIKAFCERIKEHGHDCGIYANLDYIKYKLDMKPLEDYPLWLANYGATEGQTELKEFMRQTTNSGKVQGIAGNVDLDECFAEINDNNPSEWLEEAIKWAVKNSILRGDTSGNLVLREPCTVEKAITFLYRALKNIKFDIGE